MKRLLSILLSAFVALMSFPIALSAYASSEPLEIPNNCTVTTINYVTHGDQQLLMDCYGVTPSTSSAPRPVYLYSFGGAWEFGSREDKNMQKLIAALTAQNWVVCCIDYRLGVKMAKEAGTLSKETWMETYLGAINMGTEDIYAATRYLINHSEELQIDTTKIVLAGSSAGAFNSLSAVHQQCSQTELACKYLSPQFRYAGVISQAGALWFAGEDTPLYWSQLPCPILFFHGSKDPLVTYDESHKGFSAYGSVAIYKHLASEKSPACFYDFEERGHEICVVPMHTHVPEIMRFLKQYVIQGEQRNEHIVVPKKE
jgi:acetyl esterase/lipase